MGRIGRRRVLILALTASLGGSGVIPDPAAARPVKQRPRLRQILVVDANVQEAWDERDNADTQDLARFAWRVSWLSPHPPDVVLLQEVTRDATLKVARFLKTFTHRGYAIAASAGESPVKIRRGRAYTSETSILINRRTMRRVGKPRVIETTYGKRHGAKGLLPEVKRNVAVLVRERRSGATYPIANVHFHTSSQLRSMKWSRRYRARWTRKVSAALRHRWPWASNRAVIGGDFNAFRAESIRGSRRRARWWEILRRRGFRDSVFDVKDLGGVDYVFTRTRIAAAGVDRTYNPRSAGSSSFYSDHRLRWALLGPWKAKLNRVKGISSTRTELRWRRLPSVRSVRIERRLPHERRWVTAGRVGGRTDHFYDRSLEPTTRYVYRIVAWNGAESSRPSRLLRAKTRRDVLGPRRPHSPNIKLKISSTSARLAWWPTRDRGGSGIDGYEVWRKLRGEKATRIGRTRNTSYVDNDLSTATRARYFVIAYDRAGNPSRRSRPTGVLRSN